MAKNLQLNTEAALKDNEIVITKLGKLLAKRNDAAGQLYCGGAQRTHDRHAGLSQLIYNIRPYLKLVTKAKAGKLFRILLDNFLDVPGAVETQVCCVGLHSFTAVPCPLLSCQWNPATT